MGQIVNPTAQLNWDVIEEPVKTESGIILDGWKSIRRSDNDHPLQCVRNSYSPLTNEQFVDMVNKLQEVTGYDHHGFTTFNKGGTVLGFLKNNKGSERVGPYEMQDYLVIGNSHDGSSSIFAGTSSILLRCTNAFSMLKKGKGLSISHTKNKSVRVEQMVKYFDVYMDKKKEMYTSFREFKDMDLSNEITEKFLSDVLQIDPSGEISTRKKNQKDELVECLKREQKDLGETVWAAFNAVTYWTTHVKETRGDKVFGNCLGTMSEINDRAYKSAKNILQTA